MHTNMHPENDTLLNFYLFNASFWSYRVIFNGKALHPFSRTRLCILKIETQNNSAINIGPVSIIHRAQRNFLTVIAK
jgi:hypothetical protein